MAASDSQCAALAAPPDEPIPEEYFEPPDLDTIASIDRDESARLVDSLLHRLTGREARCRLAIGRLAAALLDRRAYDRLGFARLNDYALERLGVSERELQSMARVARKVGELPELAAAFESGCINWSKLRLLCDVADRSSVERWIETGSAHTVRELTTIIADWKKTTAESSDSKQTSSSATDDADDDTIDGEPRAALRLRCPAYVRALFREVYELASRMNGSLLAPWQALESIAAEALAGAGPDELGALQSWPDPEASDTDMVTGADPYRAAPTGPPAPAAIDAVALEPGIDEDTLRLREAFCRPTPHPVGLLAPFAGCDDDVDNRRADEPDARLVGDADAVGNTGAIGAIDSVGNTEAIPATDSLGNTEAIRATDSLGNTDPIGATYSLGNTQRRSTPPHRHEPRDLNAHELDARLRAEMRASQSVDWQMGRLLATFKRLRLYRNAGFARFEDYVRERVGISKSKADALVRLEGRLNEGRQALGAAYRSGRISWARAQALLPVLSERDAGAWIERANQVTFRRLGEEVRWAADMRDRGIAWLPIAPPPLGQELEFSDAEAARQMCARYDADATARMLLAARSSTRADTLLRITGPTSVIALARDTMVVYAKPDDAPWQSFRRVLLAAKQTWEAVPGHRDPVFRRDNWRCRVPACSSRRNLHDHHIIYRSQRGDNARSNRVTVCAAHHHRGIHSGVICAHGDGNGEIHWQLGVPRHDSRQRAPLLETRNDVYADAARVATRGSTAAVATVARGAGDTQPTSASALGPSTPRPTPIMPRTPFTPPSTPTPPW